MRDMEERLRKVAVPRPEVPAFRARLRSRLLEACRSGAPSPAEGAYLYRGGFVLCGTCALLLAFVVGLFVWNPAWPARIHGTIWGRGESRTAVVRTGPEGLEKQAVPHLPSVPGPRPFQRFPARREAGRNARLGPPETDAVPLGKALPPQS